MLCHIPSTITYDGFFNMKISLIIATLNRSKPLQELLESLAGQNFKDFEVIIVDQNQDDRLNSIIEKFRSLRIQHLKIPPNGVSNARNFGVQRATGEFLGFPDDDCAYFPETINLIAKLLSQYSLVSGRCVKHNGQASVTTFETQHTKIGRRNVWHIGVEASLFIHRNTFNLLGGFNEGLGIGSLSGFGAGEGTDLILRFLDQGGEAYYYPNLEIYHPEVVTAYDAKSYKRAYSYGRGIGRVLKLNNIPIDKKISTLLRPALGSIIFASLLNLKKSKFYYLSFIGRLEGYFS